MEIFTICDGNVTKGAKVQQFKLASSPVIIPAIIIGQEGRGRSLGVLPVHSATDEETFLLDRANVGTTKAGKPKLFPTEKKDEKYPDHCLVVLRTPIGFRGSNSHNGDRVPDSDPLVFQDFPGEIITRGYIAQGDAGRMGGGDQLIAIMPKNVVFRTGYGGRRYGSPTAHYYLFDGEQILSATWEERLISDLF